MASWWAFAIKHLVKKKKQIKPLSGELEEVSVSEALIFSGHLNICKDTFTVQVSCEHQRQLLIQAIRKLTREDDPVDLLGPNKEEMVRLVKSDGRSNHGIPSVKLW